MGDEAEELVYLYSACDRALSWTQLSSSHEVSDRWTGTIRRLEPHVISQFVDLSTVNELDVVEHAPQMRAQHGDALLALFQSWEGLGSTSVTSDAYCVLTPPTAVEATLRSR